MKNKLSDKERLMHIIDAINYINKALSNKEERAFQEDFILHTAVVKWVEIVGEASYKLTRDYKSKHLEIDWRLIEGLRHILVHDYFEVNLETLWQIYKNDLPPLKNKIEQLIKDFE